MNDDLHRTGDRPGAVEPQDPEGYSDTTTSDQGSQGRPMGDTRIGVGTGMSVGASRGNTGPGTGSDAVEANYDARDFEGATPATGEYEGGGVTNTRGQEAAEAGHTVRGLGSTDSLRGASSVGGSPQASPTLEDNYGTSTGSHGGGIGDSGAHRGSGQTTLGDTQGLGDDDTDAYGEGTGGRG